MNVENYFIDTFKSPSSRIGDDGALVGKWVYSKDLFFENVHFKRRWLTPYQIGYKAMLINISDAVAMNALPRYALLGIGMHKSMSLVQMRELSRGIRDAARAYGVDIIGGDTIGNAKLDLSVTIISETAGKTLTRGGLREGDLLAYTGKLGGSLKQLRYLMAGGKLHPRCRFVSPTLRQDFIRRSAPRLRCGMDISDGLFSDLAKLCGMNRKGVLFSRRISKGVGCSGEEYEMLIAFPPRAAKAVRRLAALTRTPLTIVGRAARGKFTNRCKAHHF